MTRLSNSHLSTTRRLPGARALSSTSPFRTFCPAWLQGPSIGKDDAATYAADVFSFIFGSPIRGPACDGRFGLTTGVGFGYYTQKNTGPNTGCPQTTPDKAKPR